MKTIFPRAVVLGSLAVSVLLPVVAQSAEYEVDTDVAASSKRWSAPTTWKGEPQDYPSSVDDSVLAPGRGANYILLTDQSEIEIGSFTASGAGVTRRIRADQGQSTLLKIGTLMKSGGADLTIEDGDGSLAVEIGTLQMSSNIEIGRGSYTSFEVTGSTTISGGLFAFNGGVVSGEKRLKLGALDLAGGSSTLLISGRGSNGGVVEVRSLSGGGTIQLTNGTHNSDPENLTTGTLEINATGFLSEESTMAEYTGVIQLGVNGHSLAVHKKGEGVQILSRANGSYYNGGTVIEGGVLAISTNQNTATSGLGSGEVEVRSGGTLAGNGRIRLSGAAVMVKSGGVIAPGAHLTTGQATLTLNGALQTEGAILSLEDGARFRFRLGADNASDQVAFIDYHANGFQISGTATVDLLNVSEGKYTLFSFNAINAGELATLTSSLALGDGLSGYQGTFGHDASTIYVNIQAIPEPSTTAFLLLGVGAAALSWWRSGRK